MLRGRRPRRRRGVDAEAADPLEVVQEVKAEIPETIQELEVTSAPLAHLDRNNLVEMLNRLAHTGNRLDDYLSALEACLMSEQVLSTATINDLMSLYKIFASRQSKAVNSSIRLSQISFSNERVRAYMGMMQDLQEVDVDGVLKTSDGDESIGRPSNVILQLSQEIQRKMLDYQPEL
jgi:hypothetical protein